MGWGVFAIGAVLRKTGVSPLSEVYGSIQCTNLVETSNQVFANP